MINEFAREVFVDAVEHGWYEGGARNFGEVLALVHSEVSEALEEWRKGYAFDYIYYRDSDGKPEGIAVELADAIIRILDCFAAEDVNVDDVLRLKADFNKTRPYRHGGKTA